MNPKALKFLAVGIIAFLLVLGLVVWGLQPGATAKRIPDLNAPTLPNSLTQQELKLVNSVTGRNAYVDSSLVSLNPVTLQLASRKFDHPNLETRNGELLRITLQNQDDASHQLLLTSSAAGTAGTEPTQTQKPYYVEAKKTIQISLYFSQRFTDYNLYCLSNCAPNAVFQITQTN